MDWTFVGKVALIAVLAMLAVQLLANFGLNLLSLVPRKPSGSTSTSTNTAANG